MTRILLATLHLLGLGIGLGAVWARALAFRGPLDRDGLRRLFYADNLWGVAAALWLITGLMRLFGSYEKATTYYLHNHIFFAKMGLFILVVALELWPMTTLIRWRITVRHGESVDTRVAPTLAKISALEAGLVIAIVVAATAMARGYGVLGS